MVELLIILGILSSIIIIAILYTILKNPDRNKKKSISNLFSTPVPIGTMNIIIYGHSGSGKSTFIQRAFTANDSERSSTYDFKEHEFEREIDLETKKKLLIRIFDYRGQSPDQLVRKLKNKKINIILFIADIAPTHKDGVKYKEEELINYMVNKNHQDIIMERVREHEQYLGKFALRLMLSNLNIKHLKGIFFLINKIDILRELKKRNVIESDVDIEEYARTFFFDIEREINKFCSESRINTFKTFCISSTEYYNLQRVTNDIIKIYY